MNFDRFVVVVVIAAILFAGAGCAGPARKHCDDTIPLSRWKDFDLGPQKGIPRGRMGGMPMRGFATLYSEANPEKLGRHNYSSGSGETSRGIIYLTKGGFIDIAHLRKASDFTAYFQKRIEVALHQKWKCITLEGKEPSFYYLHFNYPGWWDTQDQATRAKLIKEASIRIGQQLSFIALTWHEIISFFGYKSTGIFSEAQSAFTYDDNPSHALGVIVAGQALRDPSGDFNFGMTRALNEELRRRGAVSPAETGRATDFAEGKWWSGGRGIKFHFDIGEGDGVIDAWTLPGFSSDRAEPYVLPTLDNVMGRDLRDFYTVEIYPNIAESGSIRAQLSPKGKTYVNVNSDFPALVDYIREKIQAKSKVPVDRP